VLNGAINHYNGALATTYNRIATLETEVTHLQGELTRLSGGISQKVTYLFCDKLSGTCGAGVELLRNERDLTTKVGEQPWPQLVRCALIDCRTCGCVFQED